MRALGVDKILCPQDVGSLDDGYLVAVLKTSVEHGNGHAPAFVADAMQTMTIEHLDLIPTIAIVLPSDTVPWVPFVMNLYLRQSTLNGIG